MIDKGLKDAKPKAGLEVAFDELKDMRLNNMLESHTVKRVKTDNGETFHFYDKDGNLLTDPNNKHEPYTPQAMAIKTLGDYLDDRAAPSGGGTGPKGGKGGASGLDLSNVKNTQDLNGAISKQLAAEGLTIYDKGYADRKDQLFAEGKEALAAE